MGHLNLVVNLERFPLLVTDRLVSETQSPWGGFDSHCGCVTCEKDKLFEEMENEGGFHAASSWFFLRQQITSIVASCGFTT